MLRLACRFLYGLLVVTLLAALLLPPQPALAAQSRAAAVEAVPELFSPSSPADRLPGASAGTPARRGRSAAAHPDLLDQAQSALAQGRPSGPLALSLFSDRRVVARFERLETTPGHIATLVGKLDGHPLGEIHLSRSGDAFFASINTGEASYEVVSNDGRSVQITEIDSASLPPEEELIPAVPQDSAAAPLAAADALVGPSTTDDGSRIDVYVGYTTAAKNADGGTAAIQARIATAIAETNTGYANSGVNQRVVLVGTAEYGYDETNFDWGNTLSNWRSYAGVFAPAQTARDTLNADEMVLIVRDTNFCGLGYLMTYVSPSFSGYPYALVSRTCATGYYSFAHEMGHNMGAHHDAYSANGAQGAYSYSYGYWIPDPADGNRYDFRTIMAYDVPSSYGYSSHRENYWSNPSVILPDTGTATGSAAANNALTLNNTAATVAQFRDGLAPAAPASLTAAASGAAIQLNWAFSGSDVWRFRIERSEYGLNNWSEIAQTAFNVFGYSDSAALSGKNYSYRVLSDNGNGRSASSIVNMPSAPANLTASVPAAGQIRLSWGATSPIANSYRVERETLGQGDWKTVGTTAGGVLTFTDTPPTTSNAFSYRVETVSAANILSFPSNVAQKATAPGNLKTTFDNTSIPKKVILTWNETLLDASSIFIERSTGSQNDWAEIGTVPAGMKTFTDTPSNYPPSEYRYRVRSRDGSSIYSLYSNLGYTLPNSPTGLTAEVVNQARVRLSWTDNSQIESGFPLQFNKNGLGWMDLPAVPAFSNTLPALVSYEVGDLRCDANYNFQVWAKNDAGLSAANAKLAAVVPARTCVAPDQPGSGNAAAQSPTSLNLSWQDVDGETNFRVEQKVGNSWIQLWTSLLTHTTSYTVPNLRGGIQYSFRVIAVNNWVTTGTKDSTPLYIEGKIPAIYLPQVSK